MSANNGWARAARLRKAYLLVDVLQAVGATKDILDLIDWRAAAAAAGVNIPSRTTIELIHEVWDERYAERVHREVYGSHRDLQAERI